MQVSETAPVVIEAPKSLDICTGTRFRVALRKAVEDGASFVIADLTKVEFMDNVGLGILVGVCKVAKGRGSRLGVACNQEHVLRLFRITALNRVLEIKTSVGAFTGEEEAGGPRVAWLTAVQERP